MRKLVSVYLACAMVLIGIGRSVSADEVRRIPVSPAEQLALQGVEKRSAEETKKVVAGGDDFLAIIGGVFLVLVCIAAVAAKSADNKSK